MRVAQILQRKGQEVISVGPERPVMSIVSILLDRNIGALVVCDPPGSLVGIVTEREIVGGLERYHNSIVTLTARSIMRRVFQTCHSDNTIKEVMSAMTNYRVRHMPVLDNGKLSGIISLGDIVKLWLQEMETETNVLRDTLLTRIADANPGI